MNLDSSICAVDEIPTSKSIAPECKLVKLDIEHMNFIHPDFTDTAGDPMFVISSSLPNEHCLTSRTPFVALMNGYWDPTTSFLVVIGNWNELYSIKTHESPSNFTTPAPMNIIFFNLRLIVDDSSIVNMKSFSMSLFHSVYPITTPNVLNPSIETSVLDK